MTRGERVNRVKNDLWREEQLLEKLPEIDAIYDEELRDSVIEALLKGCPKYFWNRPSSSTGKYHSDDECGKYGNWLHTKRVFSMVESLGELWVELGFITLQQKEYVKAAAILHDVMKYGWPSDGPTEQEGFEHTTNEHDLIAADMTLNVGGVPDEVVYIIARHMGAWAEGPNPEEGEWPSILLSSADYLASKPWLDVGVFFPHEDMKEAWPDIIEREPEDWRLPDEEDEK